MMCPKCGKSVPEKARSCGSCGQTIDVDGDWTNSMRLPPGFLDAARDAFGRAAGNPVVDKPKAGWLGRLKQLFRR
jgi:predicted RNA-binding Zn-ribbon protein involved in translation (DUF1610 family)